jgi:hypothetical protein
MTIDSEELRRRIRAKLAAVRALDKNTDRVLELARSAVADIKDHIELMVSRLDDLDDLLDELGGEGETGGADDGDAGGGDEDGDTDQGNDGQRDDGFVDLSLSDGTNETGQGFGRLPRPRLATKARPSHRTKQLYPSSTRVQTGQPMNPTLPRCRPCGRRR